MVAMIGLRFQTSLFPTTREGDMDSCSGRPGSHLAKWLHDKLSARGYKCDTVIQEDYGWGFWIIEKGLDIWVCVGYSDDDQQEEPDGNEPITKPPTTEPPEWAVFAKHDAPFKPGQWLRRGEGKQTATAIIMALNEELKSEPGIHSINLDSDLKY